MATILVLAAVVLLAVLAAAHTVRNKRRGGTSCGCGCRGCALRGGCGKKHGV